MDADKLKQFVELRRQRFTAKARLEKIEKELAEIEEGLMVQFEELGVESVKTKGGTVYLHRQLWAGAADGDWPAACRALKASHLGDFVDERFNVSTLSAWVREMDKAGKKLSKSLQRAIRVTEKFSLRTRK